MRYDFQCSKCNLIFEFDKPLSAPKPKCPACNGGVDRVFGKEDVPMVHYANRPPWTYNDVKGFRSVSDGKDSYAIDPSYGSISSINKTPPKKRGKKKL